jgi:hypothetical protein
VCIDPAAIVSRLYSHRTEELVVILKRAGWIECASRFASLSHRLRSVGLHYLDWMGQRVTIAQSD